jgi:hypothetical protein
LSFVGTIIFFKYLDSPPLLSPIVLMLIERMNRAWLGTMAGRFDFDRCPELKEIVSAAEKVDDKIFRQSRAFLLAHSSHSGLLVAD